MMETIDYNEKEYTVTDRVGRLISSYDGCDTAMDYAIAILESKNYQEGKISEPILLAALLDHDCSIQMDNWIDLLTSEIFGTGLISYEVASKLSDLELYTKWSVIDEKYKKGIIKDEHLKYMFETINNDDEYCLKCTPTVNVMLTMLTSEEYENGNLSEETLNLFLTTNEQSRDNKIDILEKLFDKERITGNFINDEILKSILETKTPLVDKIIYYILTARMILPELKEQYVLAMLNLENQEGLSNVYNSYVEKKRVNSINGFAQNFVSHTLPLLYELDLQVSYTRKREKK